MIAYTANLFGDPKDFLTQKALPVLFDLAIEAESWMRGAAS